MNIYLFYANAADVYIGRERKNEKELYAITNNKKYAKEFIKTRNMDIFEKHIKNMTKEQYKSFANNNRECVLQESEFETFVGVDYPDSRNHGFPEDKRIRMITTYIEQQSVEDGADNYHQLVEEYYPPTIIFDKRFRKILNKLEYTKLIQVKQCGEYAGIDIFYDDKGYMTEELMKPTNYGLKLSLHDAGEEYTIPQLWVDKLSIFIRMFGHLLN